MSMASWTRSGSYSAPYTSIQRAIRLAGRILASLGLIVVVTFLSFRLIPVNEITAGLLYLVAILFIATVAGLVEVCVAEELPLVSVDAALVEMVIAHLIDNALKYSPRRTPISIGARMSDGRATIYVADRGAGISEDEQSRIFDKFYRGTNEQHPKGTGMGLAIAREIMHAHGEEISITSKPGEGSEFSFSLPLAPRSGE